MKRCLSVTLLIPGHAQCEVDESAGCVERCQLYEVQIGADNVSRLIHLIKQLVVRSDGRLGFRLRSAERFFLFFPL